LHQAQTPPAFLGQDREAAYVAEIQRCHALMATSAAPEHVFAAAQNTWNQNDSSFGFFSPASFLLWTSRMEQLP
jgi:hypothetical protein